MVQRARVGAARSVHVSADAELLGVGLKNGGFLVLNPNNFKLWGQRRDRGAAINDIRCVMVTYSSVGQWFAYFLRVCICVFSLSWSQKASHN